MEREILKVNMLGRFAIRRGDREINDGDNRSRKVWLLLAYLICTRGRAVTRDELLSLLWGNGEGSSNPLNALKTTLYRVRSVLDQLGGGLGHDFIRSCQDGYVWNPEQPVSLDCEEFEALLKRGAATQDEEGRLACRLQALELYGGDFLYKLSSESWVAPLSAYYHRLYVEAVLETLPAMERHGHKEAVALCRRAVELEPYNEELYCHLMRALLNLGDRRAAGAVYEEMSELLLSNFGVTPSDNARALYRRAVRTFNGQTVSFDDVREQLREAAAADAGALLCDYDFFKAIYQAEARAVERSGDAVHLALVSISGKGGRELPLRSLSRAADNLEGVICAGLRQGDIVTRCSGSQFLLLLPLANYEDSCMVCERIIRAFSRQYPHSPAVIQAGVQPLEPAVLGNG